MLSTISLLMLMFIYRYSMTVTFRLKRRDSRHSMSPMLGIHCEYRQYYWLWLFKTNIYIDVEIELKIRIERQRLGLKFGTISTVVDQPWVIKGRGLPIQ